MATLAQVLRPIAATFAAADFPDLLIGLEGPDDAAVYRLTDDIALVQTVDFFPPVVDDARQYGGIAAANAMSDVYAMGGEVLLALNIAAFPEDADPAVLGRILEGGAQKVREAGGVVAGGHTLLDAEPKYGLAVTGIVRPDAVIATAGARPGDALVLTKPLGTGIVLTAAREGNATAQQLDAAVSGMLTLNRHASHVAREAGAHAMTDVTGFGLLGHAAEMAERSGARIVIDVASLPLLPGALDYAAGGVTTGGARRNREGLAESASVDPSVGAARTELLFDPQTSGGLLVALPRDAAIAMARRLRDDGLRGAVVGRVEAGSGVVAG